MWHSRGGSPAPAGHTGLFHTAFLYPTRADLGRAYATVKSAGIKITGSADHGVSEAIYFDDPDGNGIELYWDRPTDTWPRTEDGTLAMVNTPFDLHALLALAD